jgi:vitamin B12 transporter
MQTAGVPVVGFAHSFNFFRSVFMKQSPTLFLSLVTTTLLATSSASFAASTKKYDPCDGKVYSADGRLCTVITANRFPQQMAAVGSSISVITSEEMERRGIRNVADALKRMPGVAMARTGGFGSTTTMRIRGSNPGQVRVLLDGVMVNDPTNTETFFDFGQVLINNIERIEVIRGPQSALYGSDTTGGVISIITKRQKGQRTSGFAETGTYGTTNIGLGHQGSIGNTYYGISGQRFKDKGFSRNAATPDEEDGTQVEDLKANIGVNIDDNTSVNFSGGASHDISDFDPSLTTDGPATSKRTSYYGSFEGKTKVLDGKLQNTVKLGVHQVNRKSDEPTGFFRFSTFDGKRYMGSYQADLALRKRDVLTGGIGWKRDKSFTNNTLRSTGITSTGIDRSVNNKAIFSQYVFGATDDWTITFGGRHDDHQTFGGTNTYRITTAYDVQATNTLLRSSYGTGFKAPSLFQLFAAGFGTPTLKPEKSKGIDFGFEQRLVDNRLVFGMTAFENEYDNLITFDSNTFTYQNINKANTRGIESSASFAATPELLLSANHTYLLSENEATKRSLARRPKHTATVGADLDVSDRARIGGELLFVSSQKDRDSGTLRVRPHTTVNLNGGFDINEHYEIYTNLENIFDKDYEEIAGYRAPGFTAFVGIRGEY